MSKVHRLSRKRVGLTINVNSETGAYYYAKEFSLE